MANACFRCKQSIGSGDTFCTSCRSEVDLSFEYTQESRMWVAVGLIPVLILLSIAGSGALGALEGQSPGVATALGVTVAFPFAIIFSYALYRDFQHVSRRDDTDWNPSKWLYIVLAGLSIPLPVLPVLVGPYHLYKRKQTLGLALRRSKE
jgi:hypothetical protein